jgi:predicted metal-dependent hydrolase
VPKPSRDPDLGLGLLERGARLLERGEFFDAHEAFEDLWRTSPSPSERDFWQGMSQMAAALVKHERGEPATAISLLAKARLRLLAGHLAGTSISELKTYLDALAAAVAAERNLPATALPGALILTLRRKLAGEDGDAEGPPLS